MRKSKKTLAILAIVAMVFTMIPAQVFAASTSTRIAGADRIATAIAIADAVGTSDTVILAAADDDNLVDTLAVAPLAGKTKPIYLTYKNSLNADVKAKLTGKKVIAIGAISDAVINDAKTVATSVEKISGADRLATNALINAKLTSPAGTFVVGYNAIPDALSVASFAAANNYAIVLANVDGSVDASKIVGSKTYVIGGPTLVKDITNATRLYGADRYATNNEVIKALGFSFMKAYVANGESLVDALAGAVLAAQAGAPILLADNSGSVNAAAYVNSKLASNSSVIALGGTGVVADTTLAKVVYTAPATPIVESVSAADLGQIKVVFSQAMDKASATDPLNYTLVAKNGGTADLTSAIYSLSENKTTVTIDLNTLMTNQKDYTLTVKNARDVATSTKIAETSKDFSVSDLTLPVVSKVEITGTKTIKVTMSENVDATQDRVSFKLDNGALSAPSYTIGTGTAREIITLTLAAELSTGSHTLSIDAVKDLAGLYSVKADFPLNYAKDTTAPTVSIKEIKADAKTVIFKFNKDIDSSTLVGNGNIQFSHTYKGSNQVTGTSVTKLTDSEYQLVFGAAIPPGTTTIFIDYASGITDTQKVKDLFSNVFVLPVTLTATITADFTAPTVTSVSQKDADEIYVNFSEDVNASDAQIVGNYKLLNSSNETVSLASATYVAADKRTTLKAAADLKAGAYTLEVKNIYDKAVVPNKLATVTFNIDLVDKVAPVVSAAAWTASSKKITIKFSKDMVGSELTALSNYALIVDGASKDWPTGTAVALKDAKTVEITLGSSVAGLDATNDKIQLSGAFKSSAGIAIGGISVEANIVLDTSIIPAYVANSAKVTGKKTVTFELGAELKAIDKTKIKFNNVLVADASYVNSGSKSTVTLTLASDLANTAAAGWSGAGAGSGIEVTAGAYTASFGGASGATQLVVGDNVKDKCAPYIKASVTDDVDSDGQIDQLTLTLSEAVISSSVDVSDFNLSGSYSIHSVTSVNGATVVLKINESGLPDTGATPSVAIAGTIEDLLNNSVASGDAVVSTDGAAPIMISARATSATTLEVTYSEEVSTTTAGPTDWVLDLDGAGGGAPLVTSAVAATDGTAKVIVLTFAGGTFSTGVADVDATLTYTQVANDIDDGVTATPGNPALTPQTITGFSSGF